MLYFKGGEPASEASATYQERILLLKFVKIGQRRGLEVVHVAYVNAMAAIDVVLVQ